MSGTGSKIDVAGLQISAITKRAFLEQVADRVARKEKTFVVTPYSEFLYSSLRSKQFRAVLNSADFSLPDGIGILWAHYFLSQPFLGNFFYLNALQAWLQLVWTGASILLHPSALYKNIPEKIVGADLIWDLANVAQANNFRLYLLGGRGDVAQKTADQLQKRFPNLKIVGTSNKDITDQSIFADVNSANADLLLVAFKAQQAEEWILENLPNLNVSFAIALGGTFDYVAGVKKQPPKFIRQFGLEWLYRLITQPSRVARIYRGVFGLMISLVRYKVYEATTFRSNVAVVVINNDGKILLCQRSPNIEKAHPSRNFENYWQFPQGGLDNDEEPIFGAQRELQEETGIKSVEVLGQAKFVNEYKWNNATRPIFTSHRYHHKGQKQITVFFKFISDDSEVSLDQHELINYQWLNPTEALNIIADERRDHAKIVLAELAEIK